MLQAWILQLYQNRGFGAGALLKMLYNFSEQFYAE